MNIAIEISPLLTASGGFGDKSGVYRYMYGLIDALSKTVEEKDKDAKIILFSFNYDLLKFPLNPEVLKFLSYKNVRIVNNIPTLPAREITDNEIFDIPFLKSIFRTLNTIFHLSDFYFKYRDDKRFREYAEFLRKEFMRQKIDMIYHSETGFFPIQGFTHVITIYDLTALLMPEFHREQTVDLQKRKIKFAKKYCEGISCISNSTKKDLFKLPGFSKNRNITVIYPGLDLAFQVPKKQDKISFSDINLILKHHKTKLSQKKYLLYYGTFEPRKNLIYLMQAFTDLQRSNEIPDDYKLVLMGGEGWGHVKNAIRNFVRENFPIHTKNNIIVLDYLNDDYVSAFIQNASALVYPSIYEGFGLPVLESMALGTPVICSNTSSLPEVGGDALLYINPKNFFDLKEKIKYFINKPNLALELSEKGKKQSKKFDWNHSGIKLFNFLETLITNA